jgi:hypothetical protein
MLRSQLRVLLCWLAGAVLALWATFRPDFLVTWSPPTGEPQLVLGAAAIWTMVGHLVVTVAMSVYLESAYRSAGPDDRRVLAAPMLGFYTLLGYLALCLSLSLLFSVFYAPLWLASSVPVVLVSGVGLAAGANRYMADLRLRSGRPVVYSSFSLFGAGVYVMFIGISGEISKLTGLRFTLVTVLSVVLVLCLGLLLFFISNRAQRQIHAFVDRNFLLSHYDYRYQWTEVSRRIRPDLKLPGLLRASSEALQDIFSVRDVAIFLRRRGGGDVLDLAYSTIPGEGLSLRMDEPLTRHLERTRQALQLSRRSDDFESVPVWVENFDILERTGGRTWSALQSGGEMIGMIGLGPKLNDLRFTYEDLDYLDTLCLHFGNALWGARLSEEWTQERETEAVRKLAGFVVHDLQSVRAHGGSGGNGNSGGPATLEAMERSWGLLLDSPASLRQRCGLNDLVEESAREYSSDGAGDRQQVAVRLELSQGVPDVAVDPARIRAVIRSLLHNAADASPAGGEVRLRTRPVVSHGGSGSPTAAVVSVSDSGEGMTPEFREGMLFRPFITTKDRGMGMALFRSRTVVEAHGGILRAASEPGQGATFEIELPAADAGGPEHS